MTDPHHPAPPTAQRCSGAVPSAAVAGGDTGATAQASGVRDSGFVVTGHREPATENRPKRRYTVSEKVLAAARVNLAKAVAVPKEIRLRNTPRREAARRQNLEKAWAKQRDPRSIPTGHFRHGVYCKDLRRSACLAGEDPAELDRLEERLVRLFPPANEREAERLGTVLDRLWRVRRALKSWAHEERLAFYDALFRAAAEPHGIGIDRVQALAESLAAALDLCLESVLGLEERLTRQQRRLARAVERWRQEVERGEEAEGKRGARPGSGSGGERWDDWTYLGTLGRKQHVGADLVRAFAEQGWVLPEATPSGYRMHLWLVRAAVVGGNQVGEKLSAALEDAIRQVGETTWERLRVVPIALAASTEVWENNLAEWERQGESGSAEAGEGGEGDEGEGAEGEEEAEAGKAEEAEDLSWVWREEEVRPQDALAYGVLCWKEELLEGIGVLQVGGEKPGGAGGADGADAGGAGEVRARRRGGIRGSLR